MLIKLNWKDVRERHAKRKKKCEYNTKVRDRGTGQYHIHIYKPFILLSTCVCLCVPACVYWMEMKKCICAYCFALIFMISFWLNEIWTDLNLDENVTVSIRFASHAKLNDSFLLQCGWLFLCITHTHTHIYTPTRAIHRCNSCAFDCNYYVLYLMMMLMVMWHGWYASIKLCICSIFI